MNDYQLPPKNPRHSKQIWVLIENTEYPVQIEGSGDLVCLCIGIGSLMERTLSARFKQRVTVYSTDLYFIGERTSIDPERLSMETLSDHILQVLDQLKLTQVFLVAHSCFGILALDVAKRLDSRIKGVILVGSPPRWNDEAIKFAFDYFTQNAEPERVANDLERRQQYARIKKPSDSEVSIEKYISDSARYWGNFQVSDAFIHALWEGVHGNDAIINHYFETVLPNYDLAAGIESISCPVILLAGEADYDCLPLLQWKNYPKPANFTVVNCGKIGHWPNLEAADVFDEAIFKWVFI